MRKVNEMIFVAVGSSLPFCGIDSQHIVLSAFSALRHIADVTMISPLYATPAWPNPDDPPFVNAVAGLNTAPPARELLAALLAIEAGFGRRRAQKNAPRTLDLDLIAYHDEIIATPTLSVPHPSMPEREFVLAPLVDIAPDWRHPALGLTASEMLSAISPRAARRID